MFSDAVQYIKKKNNKDIVKNVYIIHFEKSTAVKLYYNIFQEISVTALFVI